MSTGAEPTEPAEPVSLPAPTKPFSDVLARGADPSHPLPVDVSAAALEAALQKEADERREERFYWICACVVLMDLATFPHIGFVAVICVFLIELLILAGLARKYADERIAIAVDRIIASICEKFGWK